MRAEGGRCFCKASVLVCLLPAICEAFLGPSRARATHCFDSHTLRSRMRTEEDSSSIPRSWHTAFTGWVRMGSALMNCFVWQLLASPWVPCPCVTAPGHSLVNLSTMTVVPTGWRPEDLSCEPAVSLSNWTLVFLNLGSGFIVFHEDAGS